MAFAATLAVVLVLGVFVGTASAQQAGEFGDPDVAARAWVLKDLKSGEYLAGEDATSLVAKRGYEKPSLGQRLWYTVGGIFE